MNGGTGKSMKNALHVQRCGKGTSQAVTLKNEKIKPLTIVELRKSEGIRQLVSRNRLNNFF